ncbi:MAG TPA: alginate lyase family protein, partial [Longimicrobiaceae bacterium]|nr:alginate lyase family protein [Longimicrobiaceae bacterium]
WIYAWAGFHACAPFAPGDPTPALLRDSLEADARLLRERLTPGRNHRTFELYALFIAALAVPGVDPSGRLARFAMDELHANLLADVLPDGVHREASTHYHHVALRTFLGARENARRFGLRFPDGFDQRLLAACEFSLHTHHPGGQVAVRSDGDAGSYLDLLALAGEVFGRDDFRYAASRGARGAPPPVRHASFPVGGYHVQRGPWSAPGARCLVFDCGPLGAGGHGHYDLLSVEASAGGRPLLVDPGRFTYDEAPPNWRHYFKGTAAHNTVTVDGLDQTPYARHEPYGPVAQGRLVARWSVPGLDVLCGEARSPVYDAVHTRRVFFVGDEYWVIADTLCGSEPHRFDLRFHLAPEAWGRTAIEASERGVRVTAPGLGLVFPPGSGAHLEEGWVSPAYGVRVPAPVVRTGAGPRACARFVSVVFPLAGQAAPPWLKTTGARAATPPGWCEAEIRVDGPSGTRIDRISWQEGGSTTGTAETASPPRWTRSGVAE